MRYVLRPIRGHGRRASAVRGEPSPPSGADRCSEAIQPAHLQRGEERRRRAASAARARRRCPGLPRAMRCAARGVTKAFGDEPILRGVDLEIPEGTFAVLVGPSGCGKSTLLRLVAGLEQADAGTIELAGRDVTDAAAARSRRGDGLPELRALPAPLRARQPRLRAEAPRRPRRAEIARADRGGERDARARHAPRSPAEAALGRAAPARRDGPRHRAPRRRSSSSTSRSRTSTPRCAREVRVEIRRLHDRLGATTLYVTHDQVEAMTLADTLWVLERRPRRAEGRAARGLRAPGERSSRRSSARRR